MQSQPFYVGLLYGFLAKFVRGRRYPGRTIIFQLGAVRLSEANGDVGRGELLVYRAANQSWFPACLGALDNHTAANLCSKLGYS